MYSVYIVECTDGSLYTGIATDVARRFAEHVRGVGAAYTRSHPPVRIAYIEHVGERGAALQREYVIKCMSARAKRVLCGIL